jgi:hypothetical protein
MDNDTINQVGVKIMNITDDPMTQAEMTRVETFQIARAAMLGIPIDVDPDLAEFMGAFEETALDLDDALDTRFDVDPDTGIVFDDSIEGSA